MADAEERSQDLSDLADVEAPDTVQSALRRFRWRVLLWVTLPLLVVVVAMGTFLYLSVRPNLDTPSRIQRSAGEGGGSQPRVHEIEGYEVIVLDAVELRPNLGQQLLDTIFRRDRAERTTVGLQVVIRGPERGLGHLNVRPRDWDLLERNVFAGAARSGELLEDGIRRIWLILEPDAGTNAVEMVLYRSDPTAEGTEVVGEFVVPLPDTSEANAANVPGRS